MGFENLQQQLKDFFDTEASRTQHEVNLAQAKEVAMAEYLRQKKTPSFLRAWKSNWIRSAVLGAIIISIVPIIGGERTAGELQPTGLVEIVRDGEIFIATKKTPLRIGDQILVGNNSSASIQMRHTISTTAGDHTQLRITKPNSLFLVRGDLTGNFTKLSTIATDRGQITGTNASLNISVSDTGETHIQPQTNNVLVTTWDNQQATLVAGEELRLNTESTLPREFPDDLNLSDSQILAIRAKLLISRTKALNALESKLAKDHELFQEDLASADRSFFSVVQVLKSSRNLEIVRRENLSLLSRSDVVERVTLQSPNPTLAAETRAVEALLDIIEKEQAPTFATINTDSRIFNRYVLLQRLFAPLATNSRLHGKLLQKQYINAQAKQIIEANDPKATIIALLKILPASTTTKIFLQELKASLPEAQAKTLTKFMAN